MSPQNERREYPNPPIEEALCQVVFGTPLAWNVATPGLIFEALRDQYPQDPEAQDQIEASLQLQQQPGTPNFAINRGAQRYIFKDKSTRKLVVANATTCSVNSLRPYEGWPSLRNRLQQALQALGEVTPLKEIERINLRYINRVQLPSEQVDTDNYFHVKVRTADSGKAPFRAFMHRIESMLDKQTIAISTFASLQDPPHSFLLDLDFQRNEVKSTEIADILKIADELKRLENREFESLITDKTREIFQ